MDDDCIMSIIWREGNEIKDVISYFKRRFVGLVCRPLQALFEKKMKIQILHKLSITYVKNNKQSVPYLEVMCYVIHISSK